jgi:hypothetical protein
MTKVFVPGIKYRAHRPLAKLWINMQQFTVSYSQNFLPLDLTLDQSDSKRYPRCSRSHILHNHTLKGGLRAGKFSVISQVDSIENCAAICCNEKNCNLALMLDEVCYIGDCANADLCVPVLVLEDSKRTSQIAFISNPRKALDNDLIKGTRVKTLSPLFNRIELCFAAHVVHTCQQY